MADWLGHLIANWPLWAVAAVVIILFIGWFLYAIGVADGIWPFERREWWQNKINRKKQAIKKQKKG